MSDSGQKSAKAEEWGLSLQAIAALSGTDLKAVHEAAKDAGVANQEMLTPLPNDTVAALFSKLGFELIHSHRLDGPPIILRKARRSLFYQLIYTTSNLSLADRPDVPQAAEVMDYLHFVRSIAAKCMAAKGFQVDALVRERFVELADDARHGNRTSLHKMATSVIEAVRLLAEVEQHQPRLFREVLKENAVWPVLDSKNANLRVNPTARHFLGKSVPFGADSTVKLKNATGRVAVQLLTFLHAYREVARKLVATAKRLNFQTEPPLLAEIASLPDFYPATAKRWVDVARKAFEASYPDTSRDPLLRQLAKLRPAPHKHSSDAWSNVAKRILDLAVDPAPQHQS